MVMSDSTLKRFANKVVPANLDECWVWTGAKNPHGYSNVTIDNTNISGHRASFAHWCGPIPEDSFVCHRCDVRACVNPSHLFLGTRQDNIDDMVTKGRQARGEDKPTAKLKESDILSIRRSDLTTAELAEAYGVSSVQIRRIITRKRWRHI